MIAIASKSFAGKPHSLEFKSGLVSTHIFGAGDKGLKSLDAASRTGGVILVPWPKLEWGFCCFSNMARYGLV